MDSFNKVLCLYITALFLYSAQARRSKKRPQYIRCITRITDYQSIVESPCFVDKSLLIKDYVEMNGHVLLNAPKHFGKTVNLRMLEAFLKMEDKTDAHGLTKGCSLIKQHDLNIHRYKDGSFFNTHCGKYPVLYVSFKGTTVSDFGDIFQSFRVIIQRVFEEHNYLLESADIEASLKSDYKSYRDNTLNEDKLKTALPFITKLLKLHFKAQVLVLLDDYEAPLWDVIRSKLKTEDVVEVTVFVAQVVQALLEDNEHVGGSYVTTGLRLPVILTGKYFKNLRFLSNHTFANYYGLTTDEVKKLLGAFNLTARYEDVQYYYKGYKVDSSGETIYSTWSIMNYLQSGELEDYWTGAKVIRDLERIFVAHKAIRKTVLQLLHLQDVTIDYPAHVSVDDIMLLQKVTTLTATVDFMQGATFLAFMYDNGYFTPSAIDEDAMAVTIPYREIFDHLYSTIFSPLYFKKKYKLDKKRLDKLKDAINKVGGSGNHVKKLIALKRSLVTLFSKNRPRDHDTLVGTIYYSLSAGKGFVKTKANIETAFSESDGADLATVRLSDGAGLIIQAKYSKDASGSEQALIEAAFKHAQILDQVPHYRGHIKRRIYIGFNFPEYEKGKVNETLVTICCLVDSKSLEDKICV